MKSGDLLPDHNDLIVYFPPKSSRVAQISQSDYTISSIFKVSMQRELVLQIFIPLIAILNPLAIIPFYLATNPEGNFSLAKKDARAMATTALLILIIGGFVWTEILGFFGLDMRYFRVAWWFIIAYNGFRMVSGLMPAWHLELWQKLDDINSRGLIVPITMPLVSWPGSLAFVIGRFGNGPEVRGNILLAIVLCCIIYYLIIRYSVYLQQLLWQLGIALITRFMGLILLGIGLQTLLTNI